MNSLSEMISVFLSIVYLLLAMRENRFCFIAGFISSCIFTLLFFTAHLFMETGLQVFYAAMSIYGWCQWSPDHNKTGALQISTWTFNKHLRAILATLILSTISAFFLVHFTNASYPFFDSVVTWGSLVTTYMVTHKILENWLYWTVLDSIGMCLYFNKALYLTAALFFAYVILAILGHLLWLKSYRLSSGEDELNPLLDTGNLAG